MAHVSYFICEGPVAESYASAPEFPGWCTGRFLNCDNRLNNETICSNNPPEHGYDGWPRCKPEGNLVPMYIVPWLSLLLGACLVGLDASNKFSDPPWALQGADMDGDGMADELQLAIEHFDASKQNWRDLRRNDPGPMNELSIPQAQPVTDGSSSSYNA